MRLDAHNPFGASPATVPQIGADARPVERPLRVLAWVDRYPPFQLAGGETMLHAMLRHLVRRGHRVDVVTNVPRHLAHVTEWEGVRLHDDPAIPDLIDGCDVLVGHLLWTRQVVMAAARGQIPLVYLFHNTFTVRPWALTPNNLTAVVWNSEWLRAENLRRYSEFAGLPSTIVRPPTLLADYAVPPGRHRRERVTLINPNPDKGGLVLRKLAADRPHDLFLGVEGAYGQQLRPQTANCDWQPQTADIVGDVYARTRVLLMPSTYESWGRAGTEALCSGIPVIAHPTEGLRESLGPAGIFVDRDDINGWNRELDRLSDPDEYQAASELARARAVELDALATVDLAGFERLIAAAAGATEVRSRGMTDQNSPAADEHATRVPVTATRPGVDDYADRRPVLGGVHPPDAGPVTADDVDGEPEPVTGNEGNPALDLVDQVPENAADVAAWIRAGADDQDTFDRATAAQAVEQNRDGGARKTVSDVYDAVLRP